MLSSKTLQIDKGRYETKAHRNQEERDWNPRTRENPSGRNQSVARQIPAAIRSAHPEKVFAVCQISGLDRVSGVRNPYVEFGRTLPKIIGTLTTASTRQAIDRDTRMVMIRLPSAQRTALQQRGPASPKGERRTSSATALVWQRPPARDDVL